MSNRKITSVEEFHRVVNEDWKEGCVFRGEESIDYALVPKFGRYQVLNGVRNVAKERAMLEAFRVRAASLIGEEPQNEWEWLGVAQRSGLDTRMLDWTDDPFVAAFFATRSGVHRDRAVYVLDSAQIARADSSVSPFDASDPVLFKPAHPAARNRFVTVQPVPTTAFQHRGLTRYLIRTDCVPKLHIMLETYGVDRRPPSPDLERIAHELNAEFVEKKG